MKLYQISVLAFATVSLLPFQAMATPKGCVFYEPGFTTFRGKLSHGTPWTLVLDKPVCIEGKERDITGQYPTEDAVKSAVLITKKGLPPVNPDLADKEVVATGTLYHKYDMSNDQVMMFLATLELATPAAPAADEAATPTEATPGTAAPAAAPVDATTMPKP